jgi:hypothetical protein
MANLAKVFRAKWLEGMRRAGLSVNAPIPRELVVHCKSAGRGEKALVYLGRYLYRGVLSEKNILSDRCGMVTFRTQDNTGKEMIQSVSGAEFQWMLLRHVLPKRFRLARDYGLLYGNRVGLLQVVQLFLRVVLPKSCRPVPKPHIRSPQCGGLMEIVAVRLREFRPEMS